VDVSTSLVSTKALNPEPFLSDQYATLKSVDCCGERRRGEERGGERRTGKLGDHRRLRVRLV
jgi:hypothetical protein